uniref:Apple domain-containing protein n=1 Tax=Brugia timori TaxID=42155 RepID=A0A0R3QMX7_9BILA
LNSCFVYKKGYRLELSANDIESTESVEFKDDCLRSCLRSLLSGGFMCRSLMHMPKDEVKCGVVEGMLRGFRGGNGMIKLTQIQGSNSFALIILDGVHEKKDFDITYYNEEIKDCFKMTTDERKNGKKLLTLDSDGAGMAVQPWTEIEFDILNDSVLNKTVTVAETSTGEVILCGKLKVKGSREEWERAKNGIQMSSKFCLTAILCILVSVFKQIHDLPLI